MLLGYRIQDLEFRILYRFLNLRPAPLRSPSMVIQLSPEQQYRIENAEQAKDYLDKYFISPFKVQWGNADSFINKLWNDLPRR
jgi:hypothetical protein